ncbi:MAG: alanine racemase [bacterium]
MSVNPAPDHLRTWVEIDLGSLRSNLAFVRRRIGPQAGILAVVKANAYGHGVVDIVRTLAEDIEVFGVANTQEALEVSAAGTGRDIMLLSPCLPVEREIAVRKGFIATVSSAAEALAYSRHGAVRVNFKIDTGMGRAGCASELAVDEVRRVLDLPEVSLHSISTHLPSADEDADFTRLQLLAFDALIAELRALDRGLRFHALNSAGALTCPEHCLDLVRPGLILYGVSPLPEYARELEPVLSWRSRVVLLRELPAGAGVSYGRSFIAKEPIRTALVAVGYADGFPRQLSGRGALVLVRGVRCPVLGRVTMDQIVIDVSAVRGIELGDQVTLIGADGDERIDVSDLAGWAGTISWDILAGIGRRVERFSI